MATEDAATLLRRCCAGRGPEPCGPGCGTPQATRPAEIIRDPGAVEGRGVFAPGVAREMSRIAGGEAVRGNAVRILADGAESFGAMLDLVRSAREEIRFENFIFRADAVGRAFADELRGRSEDGVRVRVLHDPVGAVMAGRSPADLLFRRSDVDVRLFNLRVPTAPSRRLGRDHRKLVVADGRRLVAGGICLADPWVGNCVRHCTWRDSAALVEGPAVPVAAAAFEEAWRHGRALFGATRGPGEPVAPPPVRPVGDVPVRIVTDLGASRRTQALVERALDAARREVLITNPYLIPPRSLALALKRAAARGVEVSVLVPGRNNHPVAGLSSEETLGELLEGGIAVYRWQGAMIHAKTIVVDGEWTLVGSSNLDTLSLARNAELNVEIHGSAPGSVMARLYREDCRESLPFTLGDWRHRPRRRRFAAGLASLLAPWQ